MDPILAGVIIVALLGLSLSFWAYLARADGSDGISKILKSSERILHEMKPGRSEAVPDERHIPDGGAKESREVADSADPPAADKDPGDVDRR